MELDSLPDGTDGQVPYSYRRATNSVVRLFGRLSLVRLGAVFVRRDD